MNLHLTECTLEDKTIVKTRFYCATPADTDTPKILVIEFSSADLITRVDISYLLGITYAANEIFRADGIIYDCRELRYDWGDTMTTLFSTMPDERVSGQMADIFGKHVTPKVFVVSDHCRPGLTSLCTAEMQIDPTMFLFDTVDDAFNKIAEQLKTN